MRLEKDRTKMPFNNNIYTVEMVEVKNSTDHVFLEKRSFSKKFSEFRL
jgi:hypothetical protein